MIRRKHQDATLLAGCLQGDREASEAFVHQFSGLVFDAIIRTIRSRGMRVSSEDMEDLHSTVFLNLFDKDCHRLREFRGDNGCSLASWVRMISIRTVSNALRKKGIDGFIFEGVKVDLESLPDLPGNEPDPLDHMEEQNRKRMVEESMEDLSPRHRLVLKLHIERGLPLSMVATTMGITNNNAYVLKHRAVAGLKKAVESRQEKMDACLRNSA